MHNRKNRRKDLAGAPSRIRLFVYFVGLLLVTGCDALDIAPGDSIFLNTSQVICFEFTGITAGESKSITSTDAIDLSAFLADRASSKDEILGAEVTDITLRMRFPGQGDLSTIEEATIALQSGSTTRNVGSSNSLGSGRNVIIPSTSSNIGSILQAASFRGVLDVTGMETTQEDFLLEVEVEISIEVQGV